MASLMLCCKAPLHFGRMELGGPNQIDPCWSHDAGGTRHLQIGSVVLAARERSWEENEVI